MNKKEYLTQYPLQDICWPKALTKSVVFTSTSGSTGEPFYFPRHRALDQQYSIILEQFLKNNRKSKNEKTLVIVCFGMGVWIGGVITYHAFELVNERGTVPISVITPGVNKKEIFSALKHIAPEYDSVILCGYPPFIKDVIDEALTQGIKLASLNVKLIFAAESFSETFRDYVANRTGIKNVYTGTMNIYGSADLGAMAYETPLSIFIRRHTLQNKKIYQSVFVDSARTPTFAQWNPSHIYFESKDKTILITGNNALPLIRYEIGDHGGVISFEEVVSIFKEYNIDILTEAAKAGISKDLIQKYPFVYVYERADFSTKLYGAIIYPEYVKEALSNKQIQEFVTGKFTMTTAFTERQDEYLEINVELKPSIMQTPMLTKKIEELVNHTLSIRSAEHKNNVETIPEKVRPHVILWPYEDPEHFRVGIKQKWLKK